MDRKIDYKNNWQRENTDHVNLTMPKGRKEIIKAHAKAHGESVNGFINRAISETMKRGNREICRRSGYEAKKIAKLNKQTKSELSKDQVIALMEVYASEWIHRDELFWKEFFTFFYANLIVIVLPNVANGAGINLPNMGEWVFRFIGIIMAICFWYITVSNSHKLLAAKVGYEKLMENLGKKKYKRIPHTKVKDIKCRKFFSISIAQYFAPGMFICLIIVAGILWFYQ